MVDLRKDKRAPASLKVKYKSVTVDQFIDQFGTDVSRGGIFVKTKKPIEIGALLKLELQLNDASPVIHGIGRVCWRREPGPDPTLAAGMGIKFIKLDPESRTIVERIVQQRGDRPSRFEQTQGAEIAPPSISPPPPSAAPSPISAPPPSPSGTAPALRGGASVAKAAAPIATQAAPPAVQAPTAPIASPVATRAAIPASPAAPAIAAPVKVGPAAAAPALRPPAAPAPAAPATSAAAAKVAPTPGARAVAGLFADSPLSRGTAAETGAELRTRSSFFPAPPSNGSGSLSRASLSRPTSGRSEQARQSGQFLATAFAEGGLAEDTTAQARAAADAGADELLDELFDEAVKTSEHPAPPPVASAASGAAHASQPSPLRESVDDMFAELSEEEGLRPSSPTHATQNPLSASHMFPFPPVVRASAPVVRASAPVVRASAPASEFDDERTTQRSSVDELLDGLDDEQADSADVPFGEVDRFAGGANAPGAAVSPSDPPAPRILSSPPPAAPPEVTDVLPRRSVAMPLIILLVLAVAGGVGFYFYQANQAVQQAAVAAAPAASAARAVVEPTAANPMQPAEPPSEPAPAVPTQAAATPAADQAAPAPSATPTPSPSAAGTPSGSARSIEVEVSSVPRGADITVDGKPVGNTPVRVTLVVDKPTEVKVSTAGYASMIRSLVPRLNNEPLRFKLEPLPYTLIVRSTPPQAQLVVGEHVALAPAPLALGHLDGGVQVSIFKDGYQRMTRLVRLDEFSEQSGMMRADIEVTLSPLPGGAVQRPRPRARPRPAAEAPPVPAPSEPETSAPSVPSAPSNHPAADEPAPAAAKPAPSAPSAPAEPATE